MKRGVYIIILNYKNWQDVVECLESVFLLKYERFKVFVIDNDSQNNSLEHLMEWADKSAAPGQLQPASAGNPAENSAGYEFYHSRDLQTSLDLSVLPPLVFIQNEHNNGFAAGNNVVLRHLTGEDGYIWLLNPDMTVEADALTELVNFAEAHPFRSIIGATVRHYADKSKVHTYGGGRINFNSATVDEITELKQIRDIDYISGGSLFAHTRHFTELGLLPEDYFLYWEETDWCYRARANGYQILVCTSAVCYDKISTTIGKGFLADFYYTRNGLLFISKFKKEKIPLVVFSNVLRMLKRLMNGEWDRCRGVYKGMRAFLNGKK